MRLAEVFRFELAYQSRRIWPWLSFIVLVVFAFLFTQQGALEDALFDDIRVNSPFIVAGVTLFSCLIWLLVAAPVAGEAGARDVATRMHPLAYTMPVSKAEYLFGRFLAAFALNALILTGPPLGNLLASLIPGVHPEAIGTFRPAAYFATYACIALPNAFFVAAIQFALASLSGRAMASYVGSVLAFFLAWILGSLILYKNPALGKLIDPIGVTIYFREMAPLWTSIEKNTRLVRLDGTLLLNRLIWFAISLGVLGVTYSRFQLMHRVERAGWRRFKRSSDSAAPNVSSASRVAVQPRSDTREGGFSLGVTQALAVALDAFRWIVKSWIGLGVLGGIPLLALMLVVDQMNLSGAPLEPRTARVVGELTAPLAAEMTPWIIIPLLIVYFAGELIWRERDARLGDIADAMPESDWVPLLGKFLALGLLLTVLVALQMTAGIVAQTLLGSHHYELGLYLKTLFGLTLPDYLLFAALALVIHVVVNQKYVGHLVAIVAFVVIALAPVFRIEHNLLIYGGSPAWSYTDMRGFGPSIAPWIAFKLYWTAWAMVLTVAARLLWVRGREERWSARLREARHRLTRSTASAAALSATLVLTLGGYVFYNTNIRNRYLSSADVAGLSAEYEQRYKRYERIPQPRLTATVVRAELYPEQREAQIHGKYTLLNRSDVSIDSIHVSTAFGVDSTALSFDRAGSLALEDTDRGYLIYALATPLSPGDSLHLEFDLRIASHGFRNTGTSDAIVENGTYFTNGNWFPGIGYQRSRELVSPRERRERGLVMQPLVPSLYDSTANKDWADRITFEAIVGTSDDQMAIAPGRLRQSWKEHGRSYFHYVTDGSIGNEQGFFSAKYALNKSKWNDVTIQVFHHPTDTAYLARMLPSMRASLDYYSQNFGPYPRGYLTVVERAGLGTGMHADAGMITHAEGFASWGPKPNDSTGFDLPSAVVAHEMAHQWTLPYAFVEGAPVMSEGIAWYAGIQVVRHTYGAEQLRRLLRFMRQPFPYAPIRRGEPLLRGLDPYMSYRRAPFALFALSEYVGEDRINAALRRMNEKHSAGVPPLVTTLDLYGELQAVAPDSIRPLLRDFFEANTFWPLKTERVTAKQNADGTWQVTLDVRARKEGYDSTGVVTELPMNDWVQIGVFADAEPGRDDLSAPVYVQMHRIRSGLQTITVTVPRKPALAGIDPYHLLDWVESGDDDNVKHLP